MVHAGGQRQFHVVVLSDEDWLTCGDASDLPGTFGEPHGPIWPCRDIGREAGGGRRRRQGNLATCGDTPDRAHIRSRIFVGEPEIAVRPSRDAAQIEVIIVTWAGKGELGYHAGRGDSSDLAGCIRVVEREPEVAVRPGYNVIG